MFMGTTYNSIDDKKRMIVPAKMRSSLGNRCILTKGLDLCLYIYTVEDWEKQLEKISKLPEGDPKVRAFIRHVCANAAECEVDKQGRIVIPQDLIDYAHIEKELVTMGAMSKIEVWAKEEWEAPDNTGRTDAENYDAALMGYNF